MVYTFNWAWILLCRDDWYTYCLISHK